MKLIEKLWQNRRDFAGKYECEGCGDIKKYSGCYDDDYFHTQVTPNWKCDKCGKSTIDLGKEPAKIATRYGPYEVV